MEELTAKQWAFEHLKDGIEMHLSINHNPISTKVSKLQWLGNNVEGGVVIAQFSNNNALYVYANVPHEVVRDIIEKCDDPSNSFGRLFINIERSYKYEPLTPDEYGDMLGI